MSATHPSSQVEGEKTAHTPVYKHNFSWLKDLSFAELEYVVALMSDEQRDTLRHCLSSGPSTPTNSKLSEAAPDLLKAAKAFIAAEDKTGNGAISIHAYDKAMEAAYALAVAAVERAEGRDARKGGA